jgi:hypothetical protein
MARSPHLNWPTIPQTNPKAGLQTSRPRDQLRLHNPKASHPPRQDVQINYLAILAIFVKQTTYLATLPLLGHLALIWPPCPIGPRIREIREDET